MDRLKVRRSWMYGHIGKRRGTIPLQFRIGVETFMKKASDNKKNMKEVRCACSKCRCLNLIDYDTVMLHLHRNGFMADYHVWVYHGESHETVVAEDEIENINVDCEEYTDENRMTEMVHEAAGPSMWTDEPDLEEDTPYFKAASQKASASRKANPKLHNGGSRSYADYRNDLMGEGEEPTAKTHKVESGERSTTSGWIDHASAEFAVEYDAEIKRLESKGQEIKVDVEENVFRSLTDKHTKRRDRRPNAGNTPTKHISKNRASSSVNQETEDENDNI